MAVFPRKPQPEPTVEVDEDWLEEWIEFGFQQFAVYLRCWAEFARLYPEEVAADE